MKYTCFAFDLDFTLTHFAHGLDSLISTISNHLNVPKTEISRILNEVIESAEGYSQITFAARIANEYRHAVVHELENLCVEWLAQNLVRYHDVDAILSQKKPFAIITAGNSTWQSKKIELANIAADHVFVVSPTEGKAVAIQKLLDLYGSPILYIDDRPSELDKIRDVHNATKVTTIQILHEDSPYKTNDSRYEHQKIATLLNII